jgi:hypothetical protein
MLIDLQCSSEVILVEQETAVRQLFGKPNATRRIIRENRSITSLSIVKHQDLL